MKKVNNKRKPRELKWYNRHSMLIMILISITFVVYIKVITLGFTRLDDSIFIIENQSYNKDIANVCTSFTRGLFSPENDIYYRPVFLVDFILESKLFGTDPAGYHFTNLLFHLICTVLLFLFFKTLSLDQNASFFLTLLFALHPVLTQAVAWIPGRNDILLMVFFLSTMLVIQRFIRTRKWYYLLLQACCLLMALFTKETGIIIPFLAMVLILFVWKTDWNTILLLSLSWTIALILWFYARSQATLINQPMVLDDLFKYGMVRLPAYVQYLGKIIFPFNLSVFPGLNHIKLWWGMIGLLLLLVLVIDARSYLKPLTIIGIAWYILFLIPVLIVPPSLNDQVFEHRLYIPIVGILLILSQTRLFLTEESNTNCLPKTEKHFNWRIASKSNFRLVLALFVITVYIFIVWTRIDYFNDPFTFWSYAVRDNPSSSYAHMMFGLRQTDTSEMRNQFEKAYEINPDEKMLNYLIGKLAIDNGKIQKAEYHLKKEIMVSQIPDNYFLLAKVYFIKNNFDSAAWCLEHVVDLDSNHPQANFNLSLLYLQMGQKQKAFKQVELMKRKGLAIPAEFQDAGK